MSFAILQLNDQALLIQAADGSLHSEPGFARLTSAGIETGETARASAWREPQHSYSQFWAQLNEAPLPASESWARHHADIAYAQLRGLWQQAGSPDELTVLVPGSFNDTQLGLLLGMIGALPAQARAIIDSALAACFGARDRTLFIDVQLHQAVLTVCRADDGSMRITDQEVFPDVGMLQIENSLARHISNLLIASHRYDPLHESAIEQAIFDQLPGWLLHLGWDDEIASTLPSERGELPFILRRQDVRELVAERLGSLASFLDRHRDCHRLLAHASGLLAGLSDEFSAAEVAAQTAATGNCLSNHELITGQIDGVYRVRELRLDTALPDAGAVTARLATHLLHGDLALPLNRPVSIRVGETGVSLTSGIDLQGALTVVLRNRTLEAVSQAPGREILLPASCRPGEVIQVDGHRLRLIEVKRG
jgi:hypothetical protein